jgi:hypothetical protein
MSNLFLKSAIRDIIPTHPEPYPNEILNYANSLYTSSKMSLPLNEEEIGRYHLCCFVVIEYFQEKYSISDLFTNKIPIKGKKFTNLLSNFRNLLSQLLLSTTPKSNRIINLNYLQTPESCGLSKSTESYIDQIRQSKLETIDDIKKSLREKLLNESSTIELATPPSTPQKFNRLTSSTMKSSKSLKKNSKLSPYKSRTKILITTSILITFCNKFYIPEHITKHILQTFKLYKNIINNSWGLLVGLVGISYIRLNNKRIKSNLNLKNCLFENLHKSQHGGLSYQDIKIYIKEISRMILNQKWIKEINFEINDDYNFHNEYTNKKMDDYALNSLTSFIDSSNELISMKDSKYVESWIKKINHNASKVGKKINDV